MRLILSGGGVDELDISTMHSAEEIEEGEERREEKGEKLSNVMHELTHTLNIYPYRHMCWGWRPSTSYFLFARVSRKASSSVDCPFLLKVSVKVGVTVELLEL